MGAASVNVLSHSFCHTTYIPGQQMSLSARQPIDVSGAQVAYWCVAHKHTPIF